MDREKHAMQIANAVETYRNVVYPWQCDHMGHMNTQFYAAVFDAACFGILNHVARMPDLAEKGLGWADIRQVIEYRHEIRSGTMMLVKSWVVEVGRTSITVLHHLVEDGRDTLFATSQTKTVLFDLKQRKATPIEGELRDRALALPRAEVKPD